MEGARRHESCPLPKTHARLRQAHALWHMAADSYGEPEAFTIHLNATLQALRTVTWVLQKESKRHAGFQDFEAWYSRHQADLKADPLLSWAVDARNEVEHEGDLERASHTIVRVLRDYDRKVVLESEAPALARTDDIAAGLAELLPQRLRGAALLEVERRWRVAELPGRELLDVLAHCYGVLGTVVAAAHAELGEEMLLSEDDVHAIAGASGLLHPVGRLDCMNSHRNQRTVRIHLEKNQSFTIESTTRVMSRDELMAMELPFDPLKVGPSAGPGLLESAPQWNDVAKEVLRACGHHDPIVAVFPTDPTRPPELHRLHGDDRLERLAVIEDVAADIRGSGGARGAIFIAEAELGDGAERPGDCELLLSLATAGGDRRTYATPFSRHDQRVLVGKTHVLIRTVPQFMAPIAEALEETRA